MMQKGDVVMWDLNQRLKYDEETDHNYEHGQTQAD